MKITVKSSDKNFSFAPKNTAEEIVQNVRMLLNTDKFTVPLDRGFGLKRDYLHRPQPAVKVMVIQEIHEAVEQYEPRAKIVKIDVSGDGIEGKMEICLELEVDNEAAGY